MEKRLEQRLSKEKIEEIVNKYKDKMKKIAYCSQCSHIIHQKDVLYKIERFQNSIITHDVLLCGQCFEQIMENIAFEAKL